MSAAYSLRRGSLRGFGIPRPCKMRLTCFVGCNLSRCDPSVCCPAWVCNNVSKLKVLAHTSASSHKEQQQHMLQMLSEFKCLIQTSPRHHCM